MQVEFNKLGIYNIDVSYLRHLHDDIDSEVYYAPSKYEMKPFLGIVVGIDEYTYFIPFSSSKPKHLKWKNVTLDHYLIYEVVKKGTLSPKAVCKPYEGETVKHILAVLDIKKMIPVPAGCYSKVDFSLITDVAYRTVLEKEYRFCQKIQDGILSRVSEIYFEQKGSGRIRKFHCNFTALEAACDAYESETQVLSNGTK
ncbi:MAG: type III toxin-antitoxin system ToxN/AbiQ family toxin [Lachnospiraceae bacterium]|nr:type III toxin-antitoxin system ToxN/AbiQ family toxin [Lachnospiraceae bacterium]